LQALQGRGQLLFGLLQKLPFAGQGVPPQVVGGHQGPALELHAAARRENPAAALAASSWVEVSMFAAAKQARMARRTGMPTARAT
jgi:hypothetical protein